MSRHRNVRNYAYEEEMYDDVYGHSIEEHDLCVSPTTAQQFLYRRGEAQHPNLSSFMEESQEYDDDYEDGGEYLGAKADYKSPKLDSESQAKLLSCMDQFRSILGDNCDEDEATDAILKHNFDLEKAIDDVLNKGGNQDLRCPNVFGNVPRKGKEVVKIEKPNKSVASTEYVLPSHSTSCRTGHNKPFESSFEVTKSSSPATFLQPEKASEPLCYSNLPSRGLGLSKQTHVKGCSSDFMFTSEQRSTDTNNDVDVLLLPNFLETGKSVMRTKPLLARKPGSPLFKKQAKGQTESFHKETVHIVKNDASLPLSQLLKMRQFSNAVNHGIKESCDRKSNLHVSDRSSSDLAVKAVRSQSDGSSPLSQLIKLKKSDALNKNASECMDGNVNIDTKASAEYSYETVTEEESPQNVVHIPRSDEFSPLSQLLKSRQSKSPKCMQYNASVRCYRNSALPNAQNTSLLTKAEDMVRIPKSDGSSPLSQLLKMRKSTGKTVKCGATEGINSNSDVDFGKTDPVQISPSPKSTESSLFDELFKRGQSHIHGNTRGHRMNCVNSLHGNKDIDLSLLLRGKKSEEKLEKIPKDSDFYKSRSANCRLLSNSSEVDGSQIQSLKRKENFALKNSLFQDSIGEKCEEITRGLGRLSYGNCRKSWNDFDDMVVNASEKCSNDMEDGLIMEPIHSHEDPTSLEPVIELLHAPSTFACALLVQYKKPGHEWKPDVKCTFQAVSGLVPFDFSTPSPDDIVMQKQKDARRKRK